MKKLLIVTFAAVALTGSALAIGANAASDSPPMAAGEARNFLLDAHLAGMKAALRLTPEQESKWATFESAVRDAAKSFAEERRAMREERDETPNPIERMTMFSERLGRASAGLKTLADAAKPLYDSLDDAQKRHFGPLLVTLRPRDLAARTMMMRERRHEHSEDEDDEE